MLYENVYPTAYGPIRYWTSTCEKNDLWLVMLPGLTADHNLFSEQVKEFVGKVNIFTWDPPAHGQSKPWDGGQNIQQTATVLHEILEHAGITNFVLVGQSMGGYLSQSFIDKYPGLAKGFVCIDSAPLQRPYYATWELEALKHTYWMYRSIPWPILKKWGAIGCATTPQGQDYMKNLIASYDCEGFCKLADEGYRALAEAIEANKAYFIDCPVLLFCGEKDAAGSTISYNKAWKEKTGYPLLWVPGAGHNSNLDNPEFINTQIKDFLSENNLL